MEETQALSQELSKAEREGKIDSGFSHPLFFILLKCFLLVKPSGQRSLGKVASRVKFSDIQGAPKKLQGTNGKQANDQHICRTDMKNAIERYIQLYTQLEGFLWFPLLFLSAFLCPSLKGLSICISTDKTLQCLSIFLYHPTSLFQE